MSWLPHDKGTWGLIIGTAALLLAFPLSLLANLVTPKIRNSWAERSISALTRRIAKLQKDLADAQQYALISQGEDFILTTIEGVVVSTGGIYSAFWLMAIYGFRGSPGRANVGLTAAAIAGILFIFWYGFFIPRLIERFLSRRSSYERRRLEENLKKLSDKLQALGGS